MTNVSSRTRWIIMFIALIVGVVSIGVATYQPTEVTGSASAAAPTITIQAPPPIDRKLKDDLIASNFTPKGELDLFLHENKPASLQTWAKGVEGDLTNVELFSGQLNSVTRNSNWCSIPEGYSLRQAVDTTDRALAEIKRREIPFVPNGSGVTEEGTAIIDGALITCYQYEGDTL